MRLFSERNALEQKLCELEVDYKGKLNSFLKETDPKLTQLRREIATRREDLQKIIAEMRGNSKKKADLLEELQINAKVAEETREELRRRSFAEKTRSNFNNFKEKPRSETKVRNFEQFSHYETFKEMKRERFDEKLQFLSNKTAPTVVFSPTNETNLRIKKMLETDQKELQEKFSWFKKI